MKHHVLSRAVAVALLAAAGSAAAITNVENNSSIPFSFSNPGARSLGMGGAFLGAADDATAAYTNPAGLTGLGLEQQVGVELRRTSYDSPFASGGSAGVAPFDPSGINYGKASSDTNSLSFLSWVLPRENWAIALYRHELLNYESAYVSDPTVFGDFFTNPYRARTDIEIVSYGASFAYDFNDFLSIGAGLSWYDFEIDTSADRYDAFRGDTTVASALVSTQQQRGDDDALGYNLGLIFRGSDNFNIGLAYRSAPKFDYRATNVAGPAFLADDLAAGVFTGELLADKKVDFEAPDTLGVGFSWRPSDNLTVNLDVNKINYSNLSRNNVSPLLNGPENPLTIVTRVPVTIDGVLIPAGTAINNVFATPGEIAAARLVGIDDVIEPRLGMEYIFADLAHPLALRLGAWQEQRHTLRFQGDVDSIGADNQENEERLRAQLNAVIFSTGSDEMHYTGGLGFSFSTFQIDFAVDMSDRQDTFSMSGVWRF